MLMHIDAYLIRLVLVLVVVVLVLLPTIHNFEVCRCNSALNIAVRRHFIANSLSQDMIFQFHSRPVGSGEG